MAERLKQDELVDHVAELAAQAARDREAAEGGRAARTGAGDPSASGRINLRPGAGGGSGGGQPAGAHGVSRGMGLGLDSTIYDRLSGEEAEKIIRWWRSAVRGDRGEARELTRELREHRSRSIFGGTRADGDPQQVSVDSLGGAVVPTQFVDEVIIALPQETPFANAGIVNIFPMGSESVEFPKITKKPNTGGETVSEGSPYTKSNAEIGTVTLFARKHGVIIPITEEMLGSSSIDLVRVLAQLVAEQLAEQRNEFITNGSGADEPEGVRTNPNVATVPWDDTDDQARADSVIAAFYGLSQRYQQNGVWLLRRGAIQLLRTLKTTDGEYLWTDGFGATPAQLLGRPVFENPDIPNDLGAGNNESEILFGDFRRGYVLGQREGVTMQQDSSGTDWERDIIRMKWRERFDGKVTDENAFVRLTGVLGA